MHFSYNLDSFTVFLSWSFIKFIVNQKNCVRSFCVLTIYTKLLKSKMKNKHVYCFVNFQQTILVYFSRRVQSLDAHGEILEEITAFKYLKYLYGIDHSSLSFVLV